jgi:propanediol dehydratase small subunit
MTNASRESGTRPETAAKQADEAGCENSHLVAAGGIMEIRTASGKSLEEISLDAMLSGDVSASDIRIHPETLRFQASRAEENGNPQLAGNLRRAAELASLPDEAVLAIYDALRPHRSSRHQLEAIAKRLDESGAVLCAGLIREAASVYEARGYLGEA